MFKSIDKSGDESASRGGYAAPSRSEAPEEKDFSLLAFVFMPQLKYSFEGLSHLYPVFMQMLAVMFVAADLLPRNHPATRYGAKDVDDYTVSELIGEAWYNLRRQRGTNMRSWGMFTSIILMCFAFIGTMGALLSRIFLGLGETAQAQIFTLNGGYGGIGPGGAAPVATDLATLAAQPGPMAVGGNAAMFDKRMTSAQGLIYDDWGLILLDKIVREAAAGGAGGGQLQNALAAILQVFNTAMTVVAAVMIFWIIVSVTVDTAKTGIVGGGRHNMVWGPIRIVFGLGLMIPLSGGFSSGQYCVMKLAEWGSNLGSNGWSAYVQNVTNSGGMMAPVVPGGSAGLVNDIAMMKVCQVAYNDYVYQATGPGASTSPPPAGSSDPAQLVGAMDTWSGDGTKLTHALTNSTQKALCGALVLAVPAGDGPAAGDGGGSIGGSWGTGATDSFAGTGVTGVTTSWTTAAGVMGTVQSRPSSAGSSLYNYGQSVVEDGVIALVASALLNNYIAEGQDSCGTGGAGTGCVNPVAFISNNNAAGAIFAAMMASSRAQVATAWIELIPTVECGSCNATTPTAGTSMNDFACSFVAHHAPGGTNGNGGAGSGTDQAQFATITVTNNTYTNTTGGLQCPTVGTGATPCGGLAVAAPPTLPLPTDDPDYSCHMDAINLFQNGVNPMFGGADGVGGTVVSAMNSWLSGSVNSDMARYGWASAGAYYTKIASTNVAAQNMTQPAISFMPGVLTTVEATCDVELGTTDCAPSGIGYRVAQIMQAYSSWYDVNTTTGRGVPTTSLGTNAVAALNGSGAAGAAGAEFGADKPGSNGTMSVLSLLHGGKTALNNAIAQQLGIPESRKPFLVSLIGSVSDNTLPLANLSALGAKLVLFGSMMMLATAIIQGVLGGINFGVSTTALGLSCMFTMLFSLCQVIIASGITLAFYVPLMPFIRSAFAVMTWMVSVFEAVVMIPIAALAHLTTEGEGLAAGAKQCWVLWLNVLTRPILFVIGFIGAFIVYDAWVVYFTTAFAAAAGNAADQDNIIMKVLGYCYNSVFYVSTCYAAANSVFKMVDLIPSALMRWMPNGQMDTSFDDGAQAAGGYASQIGGQAAQSMQAGASSVQSNISRGFSQAQSGGGGSRPKVGE